MTKTCFVTVGTTKFDDLVNCVLSESVAGALRELGVRDVLMQIGESLLPSSLQQVPDEKTDCAINLCGIQIRYYRFKESIQADIANADIVIGHAGAGTVLECLQLRKPLIVVVNELLHDNHQRELAEEMGKGGHLLFCNPATLREAVSNEDLFSLKPYHPPNMASLARYIDRKLGVVREIRMRGPLTASQFAAWGGMFSTIDCGMVWLRQKEDPLNSIFSGGATGAMLACRSGPRVMVGSAVLGAVILAMIEGVGLLASRWMGAMVDPTAPPPEALDDPRALAAKPSSMQKQSGVADQTTPFGLPSPLNPL